MKGRRITETFYVTLRKRARWQGQMLATRIGRNQPKLGRGECAVKIRITLPVEAFEPVFDGPDLGFEIGEVLRTAEIVKDGAS